MKKIFFLSVLLTLPLLAHAQFGSVKEIIIAATDLIRSLIPIAFGFALLFFFWGIASFIFKAGDEKAIEEGKRRMLWGVIALFVITSVWGLVAFIQNAILGPGGIYIAPPGPDPEPWMPPSENV